MSETKSATEELNYLVDREQFDAELQKYYRGLSIENKKTEWTDEKIQNVIQLIEGYSHSKFLRKRPSNKQYYSVKKYDIVNIGDEKALILKKKSDSDQTVRIIPSTEYYQRIHDAHIKTGHGRRDKIMNALKDKYMVPIWAINIFLQMCKTCISKKSSAEHGKVLKLISDDLNRRGHVELVDFQSTPDEEYSWLLQYQDHLTKYCFLRPLKSKEGKEVAIELLKIFLEVGCPNILQSGDGHEFTAAVLKEVASLWPICKIIIGRPMEQRQGKIEGSNLDAKKVLQAWMVDNNSTNWSLGCYFAQFQINSSHHSTVKRTPFQALFGEDPRLGLSSTHLPKNVISKLETEQDLEMFLNDTYKSNDNAQKSEADTTNQQQKARHTTYKHPAIKEKVDIFNADQQPKARDNSYEYPVIKEEVYTLNSNQQQKAKGNTCDYPVIKEEVDILNAEQQPKARGNTYEYPVIKEEVDIFNPDINVPKTNEPENATLPYIVAIESIVKNEEPNTLTCNICNQETSGEIRCQNCNCMIHATCGVSNEEEGCSWQLICNLCANENSTSQERNYSNQNLKRAADKLADLCSKKAKSIDTGTSKLIEVPKLNDSITTEVPKVKRDSVQGESINNKVTVNRIEPIIYLIPQNAVLSIPNVILTGAPAQSNYITKIALPPATIAATSPSVGGQATIQCNCKEYARKKCATNRCNCKKAKVLCNSRCHNSVTCHNK